MVGCFVLQHDVQYETFLLSDKIVIRKTVAENNQPNNRKRRIIYVDASFNNETKKSRIALYDKKKKKIYSMSTKSPKNITEAEKYAILNAFLYVKKNRIEGKIQILNDNTNAVDDQYVQLVSNYMKIPVSWIPREINKKADRGTKDEFEINVKEKYTNLLEFFYELIFKEDIIRKNQVQKNTNKDSEIQNIERKKEILLSSVKNSQLENESYSTIGAVGVYIKKHYPKFKYSSLKKELMKFDDIFVIVNDNNVKVKENK